MPKVEGLRTLFQIAVHNVVQSLDKWSVGIPDDCNFIDILGPFDVIPPKFVQIILSTACETERIKKHHLQILIDSRLQRLDLSKCKLIANGHAVAKIIGYRCRNLTELNIAGLSRIRGDNIVSLISGLPHLEILNLARTSCNDRVLIAIAKHCLHLRELDISHNEHVSDYGINCLCSDELRAFGTPLPLEKVLLHQTWIGLDAVKTLLKNKRIIHIGFKDLMTVINELYPDYLEFTDVSREEQYALTTMTYEPNIFSDMSVDHAFLTFLAYCPNVSEFILHNYQTMVTDQQIRYLISLEYLQKLHLITFYVPTFFSRGLAPLLEVRGPNITELHLEEMKMVNFEVVGYCCPKLINFYFYFSFGDDLYDERPIEQILPNFNKEMYPKPFASLVHLTVRITTITDPPVLKSEVVEFLLKNSLDLEILEMSLVIGLDDDVFERILISNPMPKLSKFCLTQCDNITRKGIDMLLRLENPLEQLYLIRCQQVKLQDATKIRRMSEKRKWKLKVEYE